MKKSLLICSLLLNNAHSFTGDFNNPALNHALITAAAITAATATISTVKLWSTNQPDYRELPNDFHENVQVTGVIGSLTENGSLVTKEGNLLNCCIEYYNTLNKPTIPLTLITSDQFSSISSTLEALGKLGKPLRSIIPTNVENTRPHLFRRTSYNTLTCLIKGNKKTFFLPTNLDQKIKYDFGTILSKNSENFKDLNTAIDLFEGYRDAQSQYNRKRKSYKILLGASSFILVSSLLGFIYLKYPQTSHHN